MGSSLLFGMHYGNIYAIKQNVSDFSFVSAGDWDVIQRLKILRNMENKTPNLELALGRLFYQKSAHCWFNMMSPLINKTRIAIGGSGISL
ncbi:MAG: hypothetical protein M3530_07500 [Thermoproteota archaeon]|nr:hypothetical protein [Thermoproteota archaeon]